MAPDSGEWGRIVCIVSTQGGEVLLPLRLARNGGVDDGKFKPIQQFEQEQTSKPTVEIGERMDVQQTAFCEHQQLQQHIRAPAGGVCDACGQIGAKLAHLHWHLPCRWWQVRADLHLGTAPTTSNIRHQIATQAPMEVEEQRFVERPGTVQAVGNVGFQQTNALCQMRRQIGVTQFAEGGDDSSSAGIRCFN